MSRARVASYAVLITDSRIPPGRFLSSLRLTSELMGPAADQADELERAIATLRGEAGAETARNMVEGALAALEAE